ncbi:DUF3427 domain-containing protein [Streptomyces sp. BE147]|uniref:DUF3427 domain-containing protein n=1 Tax=Streptomyces sp. BE147 TaxID=3002524 RepID=UPI002E7AA718|nr:DUF3427 domain-containing protein [Streptomyces sp. BE147]MEE1737095.1 DUF3427 domain-containing protein [Streptomyces sp. BE147]
MPHSELGRPTGASPVKPTLVNLTQEARSLGVTRLSDFLERSGRDIADLYRGNTSWTAVLRRADLAPGPAAPEEQELLKRMHVFLHADDTERAGAYRRLVADDAPLYGSLPERDRTLARMLFFNLWDKAGGFPSYEAGFDALRQQSAVRSEIGQILAHLTQNGPLRPATPLTGPHGHIPLSIHHAYNRSEILAALGVARLGGQLPGYFAQGVLWDAQNRTDTLLITLNKSERDFSPTVRYKDYPLSRTRFHWESQNSTASTSPTGQRYQQHAERGSHVLLFLRADKDTPTGKAQPWTLLGPATYERHTGSKPMAITWHLHHPLTDELWTSLPTTG